MLCRGQIVETYSLVPVFRNALDANVKMFFVFCFVSCGHSVGLLATVLALALFAGRFITVINSIPAFGPHHAELKRTPLLGFTCLHTRCRQGQRKRPLDEAVRGYPIQRLGALLPNDCSPK